jgi:predicted Zn-dependent peptidase
MGYFKRCLPHLLALLGTSTQAEARSPSCERAERYTLANGLEVVLAREASANAVAVVSSVHVGSRHDPPGYEGLAHYVEHLACRDSPPFSSSMDLYADAGAFGMNASTALDLTQYYALLPAAQLERAVWLEARRLAIGLDAITAPDAELEREVVLREQVYRFGAGPRLLFANTVQAALFGPDHPYHSAVASLESQAGLTLADARWFFARHYRPERVRLVIGGDFDVDDAKRIIDRHLGALAGHGVHATATGAEHDQCAVTSRARNTPPKRVALHSRDRNERLTLYWPLELAEDPEIWRGTLFVLAESVADAARQTGLSHDVHLGFADLELGSYWSLDIGVMPGQPFEQAERLVRKTIKQLRQGALDAAWVASERQRFELSQAVLQTQLMERAVNLAKRLCVPSRCVPVEEQFSSTALQAFERFDPDRALIVERRYRRGSPKAGEVEIVPR